MSRWIRDGSCGALAAWLVAGCSASSQSHNTHSTNDAHDDAGASPQEGRTVSPASDNAMPDMANVDPDSEEAAAFADDPPPSMQGDQGPPPGAVAVLCPDDPPSGSCDVADQLCSYGEAWRVDCRSQFFCEGGRWVEQVGACDGGEPEGGCDRAAPAEGEECAVSGDTCVIDGERLCVCQQCLRGCDDDEPRRWHCPASPGDDCPAVPPNLGTPCSINALECTYGDPCLPSGGRRFCRDGVWVEGIAGECGL